MGTTHKARFRGFAQNAGRFVVSGTVSVLALGSALTALSLWVAPLPDPTPTVAVPPTVYKPVEAVSSPSDASNTPTATTVPQGPFSGDCDGFVALALTVGWPAVEARQLREIMVAESACDPAAVGDGGASRGLLQIHCPTWVERTRFWPDGWAAVNGYPITCNDLHEPRTNLAVGFLIWAGVKGSSGGWWNWSTYTP